MAGRLVKMYRLHKVARRLRPWSSQCCNWWWAQGTMSKVGVAGSRGAALAAPNVVTLEG